LQKMTETEFVGLAVNIEQDRSFTYS
jgi:hypothetical protein